MMNYQHYLSNVVGSSDLSLKIGCLYARRRRVQGGCFTTTIKDELMEITGGGCAEGSVKKQTKNQVELAGLGVSLEDADRRHSLIYLT